MNNRTHCDYFCQIKKKKSELLALADVASQYEDILNHFGNFLATADLRLKTAEKPTATDVSQLTAQLAADRVMPTFCYQYNVICII